MRLKVLIAAMAAGFAVISCTEKPAPDVVPESETALSGRYAAIDRYGYSDTIIGFFLGDYTVAKFPEKYLVKDGKMWLCSMSEYEMTKKGSCRIDAEGRIYFDNEEVSFQQLGDTLVLEGHYLIPINDVVPQMHSSQKVEGVSLPDDIINCHVGDSVRIIPSISPETALNKDVRWSSDDPGIADIDMGGMLKAIRAGSTTIRVETKEGGFKAQCSVRVSKDYKPLDGEDGNLRANCYVVGTGAGVYAFHPYFNDSERYHPNASDIDHMHLLWETFNSDITPERNELVSAVSYDPQEKLCFLTLTGRDGNALIAAEDKSGKILWSWHIWICNRFDPEETKVEFSNNAGIAMDRNLGALHWDGDSSSGLFFQWGRKDPFAATKIRLEWKVTLQDALICYDKGVETGKRDYMTVRESIERPAVLGDFDLAWTTEMEYGFWEKGGKKTIFDPCPYGWKVPGRDFFKNANGRLGRDPYANDLANRTRYVMELEGRMTIGRGVLSKAGFRTSYIRNIIALWTSNAYEVSGRIAGGSTQIGFNDETYFSLSTFQFSNGQAPVRCVKE